MGELSGVWAHPDIVVSELNSPRQINLDIRDFFIIEIPL